MTGSVPPLKSTDLHAGWTDAGTLPAPMPALDSAEAPQVWKSLHQTIRGIAHGVKNPLGILLMGTEYLDKKVVDDGATAQVIDDMRNAIGRADAIVRALLDLAAADASAGEPRELHPIVEAVVRKAERDLAAKRLEVVCRWVANPPPLWLDGAQCQQAFAHLLANAIGASPAGGKITLETSLVGTAVRLTLRDAGAGFPERVLPRVFEPFFTTDKEGKRPGLGLTVARRIIEAHGGGISVGNGESGGALVSVILGGGNIPAPGKAALPPESSALPASKMSH